MKNSLLLALLLVAQFAWAQSDKLVKVTGTRCSMVPPKGFVAGKSYGGFEDIKTGASIVINEFQTSYQTIVDGFTVALLQSKGMKMISKETIDFRGSKATMICVTQLSNGITYVKQMLVFGNQQLTVLVNGMYPEASKAVADKIKTAMLSTIYNSN